MKNSYVLLFVLAVFGAGCDESRTMFGKAKATPATVSSGRFVLLAGQGVVDQAGVRPVVLRMDTATGETWILDQAKPAKWTPVQDNLRSMGKFNPETKKIEWGAKTPDGRDLNELTKEELIRLIESTLKNAPTGNPKDPLGIR